MHQQQRALESIMGKEEIADNEQFLLFPQCFLLDQKIVSPFVNIYDTSLFAAELEEPKIGMWGKGLRLLILYQAPHSWALTPTCDSLISIHFQVCALRVTKRARAQIMKAGGKIMTFDQLALKSPKGKNTVLIQGMLLVHLPIPLLTLTSPYTRKIPSNLLKSCFENAKQHFLLFQQFLYLFKDEHHQLDCMQFFAFQGFSLKQNNWPPPPPPL